MLAGLARCSAPAPRLLMHLSPAYLLPTSCLSIACMRSLSRARIAAGFAPLSHVQMHQNRRLGNHPGGAHAASRALVGAPGTPHRALQTQGAGRRTRHRAHAPPKKAPCQTIRKSPEITGVYRDLPETSGVYRDLPETFSLPYQQRAQATTPNMASEWGRAKNAGMFLSRQ
jgi:hypothetical protein